MVNKGGNNIRNFTKFSISYAILFPSYAIGVVMSGRRVVNKGEKNIRNFPKIRHSIRYHESNFTKSRIVDDIADDIVTYLIVTYDIVTMSTRYRVMDVTISCPLPDIVLSVTRCRGFLKKSCGHV